MSPAENVLSRLEKVRQRQPGQWSARCPGPNHAHGDKSPSLSIRETPQGDVLLYCFASCGATDILSAIGLTFTDLYPPRQPSGREPQRTPLLLTAGQALELLASEALLVAVAATNVSHGVQLLPVDLERLRAAAGRCRWLLGLSKGVSHV